MTSNQAFEVEKNNWSELHTSFQNIQWGTASMRKYYLFIPFKLKLFISYSSHPNYHPTFVDILHVRITKSFLNVPRTYHILEATPVWILRVLGHRPPYPITVLHICTFGQSSRLSRCIIIVTIGTCSLFVLLFLRSWHLELLVTFENANYSFIYHITSSIFYLSHWANNTYWYFS